MLNVFLTVGQEAGSHENLGWDTFTDIVLRKLNDKPTPVFFLLWGTKAGDKSLLIDKDKYISHITLLNEKTMTLHEKDT